MHKIYFSFQDHIIFGVWVTFKEIQIFFWALCFRIFITYAYFCRIGNHVPYPQHIKGHMSVLGVRCSQKVRGSLVSIEMEQAQRLTLMFITIEDGRSLIWKGWWNGRSVSLPLLGCSSPSDSLDAWPRASFFDSCLQKSGLTRNVQNCIKGGNKCSPVSLSVIWFNHITVSQLWSSSPKGGGA